MCYSGDAGEGITAQEGLWVALGAKDVTLQAGKQYHHKNQWCTGIQHCMMPCMCKTGLGWKSRQPCAATHPAVTPGTLNSLPAWIPACRTVGAERRCSRHPSSPVCCLVMRASPSLLNAGAEILHCLHRTAAAGYELWMQ